MNPKNSNYPQDFNDSAERIKIFLRNSRRTLINFFLFCYFSSNFATNSEFIGVSFIPARIQDNIDEHLKIFLPYNPIIIEIDYMDQSKTLELSKKFPYGKIYSIQSSLDFYENQCKESCPYKNIEYLNISLEYEFKESHKPYQAIYDWILEKTKKKFDCIKINSLGMNIFVFHKLLRSLDPSTVLVIKSQIRKNHRQDVDFQAVRKILKKNHFKEVFHIEHSDNICEIFTIKKHIYEAIFD